MFQNDELQFYPTPKSLAERAWAKFKNRAFCRVLEPSAGDGALIKEYPHWSESFHYRPPVDAIEIDITKHEALRKLGVDVVGIDFLEFQSAPIYSHCILNPPFRVGVQHALKAWDILWDGEIVAILNAESLRNAFSNDRQRLLQLIAKHGEVEFIADAFKGEDVEREADVEVALVYLRKEANLENDIFGNMLDGLDQDDESAERIAAEFQQRHDIALPASFIENRVSTFDAAVRAMKAAVFSEANASHYETLLGQTMAERIDRKAVDPAKTTDYVRGEVETRYAKLKDAAWSGILRSSNVTSRLSSKAQKRVESEFEQIKKLDFSVKTIYGFLTGIVESRGQIQLDMAFDVFHSITEYWTDNTVFFKGWKSNDKHRTCGFRIKTTRFVLPRNGTWCRELDWDAMQRLRDFDKVFAMLDGKVTPEVSLEELFTKHFNALCHGERLSGSYFDVRYYPGAQTIHFFPNKKLNLVDRLNRLVGKHRQWLPPSDDDVTVNFWQGYDKAEKMNEDMQRKIKKGWYGDSPIKTLMHSRNEKERQAAVDRIVPAIEETMRENKISPIFLTLENKSPQMLLLEAA